MEKCTNVCGITAAALEALQGAEMEVRRPSGALLRVSKREGSYALLRASGEEHQHRSLGELKKALRKIP